ncbi:hypothetical protein PPACK8108_LOCUS9534 [Phakopsora pachyrhizi]|uniref:Uncharacterized protein n=1 Tax=Phakopsora pachyrhizi TaxID=170000 RepID=A0AAV0AWP6_PHAPC|nr:hypothetical protein PPACK8108_LOCUS9534 [Phakopsora pachyrhizi]
MEFGLVDGWVLQPPTRLKFEDNEENHLFHLLGHQWLAGSLALGSAVQSCAFTCKLHVPSSTFLFIRCREIARWIRVDTVQVVDCISIHHTSSPQTTPPYCYLI